MTKEEKKARRSSIRTWSLTIGIDLSVVVGYLLTAGVNTLYINFLTFVHIYCWIQVVAGLLIVTLFLFMHKLIEKLGEDSYSAQSPDGQEKARGLAHAMLKIKVARARWINKYYKSVIQIGVLIFIGFVMGHWTLFVAYGLSWAVGLAITAAAALAYDKTPTEWKGADTTGDGVPDDEAEQLRRAAMNPIQLAFEEAKEKRAEEKRKKNEAAESLVDSLLEDDDF